MRKNCTLLLALAVLAGHGGCSGDPGDHTAARLAGTWVRPARGDGEGLEGIRFDPDSTFGFIGIHTMSGLDWQVRGDTLVMNTGADRHPRPHAVRTARVEAGPDTLVLGEDAGYLGGTYTRDDAASGRVTGRVYFPEQVTLPESASIHLTLREITGFLPTRLVAGQTIPALGRRAPIPFHVVYAAAAIDPGKNYEIEGMIVVDGEPRFTAAQARPVLTRGNPDRISVIMHAVPPATDRRRLKGMYMHLADAGIFTDCETGLRYPVAADGDNAALEAAYLEARSEPGEFLLVILSGRLVVRPRMEGEGSERVVVVERFLEIHPDGTCTTVP